MKSSLRLYEHKCLRCLHTWVSRLERPKTCPRCKSPRWDEPRRERKAKSDAATMVADTVGTVAS